MTGRTALFIGIIVLAGQGGDISFCYCMKRIGEVHQFDPRSLLKIFAQASRIGWMWLGVGLMMVAFFSLLAAFSWANVSLVVPATASSYLVSSLGAKYVLGERINKIRWLGVFIVCIGVFFVCVG